MPTLKLTIKGKVQGVFYRAAAKKMADATGLSGWIRNTEEGEVEAMVTGNNEQLQEFIYWCKKGPANAKVDDVVIIQIEEMMFDKFKIIT